MPGLAAAGRAAGGPRRLARSGGPSPTHKVAAACLRRATSARSRTAIRLGHRLRFRQPRSRHEPESRSRCPGGDSASDRDSKNLKLPAARASLRAASFQALPPGPPDSAGHCQGNLSRRPPRPAWPRSRSRCLQPAASVSEAPLALESGVTHCRAGGPGPCRAAAGTGKAGIAAPRRPQSRARRPVRLRD